MSAQDPSAGSASPYLLKYIHTVRANKTSVIIQRDEPLISVFLAMHGILIPTSHLGDSVFCHNPSDFAAGF